MEAVEVVAGWEANWVKQNCVRAQAEDENIWLCASIFALTLPFKATLGSSSGLSCFLFYSFLSPADGDRETPERHPGSDHALFVTRGEFPHKFANEHKIFKRLCTTFHQIYESFLTFYFEIDTFKSL